MAKILLPEGSAPDTPSTGYVAFYPKVDGLYYSKDDAGVERVISQNPASATDNAVARYDGTGGALQNSAITISDVSSMVVPTNISTATISTSIFYGASVSSLAVSTSAVYGNVIATQAQMEQALSTNFIVTPGRQHYHPGSAKAWVRFNSAGTVDASYNILSITDTGVGDWTVNIDTDFSGASTYCGVLTGGKSSTQCLIFNVDAPSAVGAFNISCIDSGGSTRTDPDTPDEIYAVFFGDQA